MPTHPSEVESNFIYSEDLPKSPRLGFHYEATPIVLEVAAIIRRKNGTYSPSKELLETWQDLEGDLETEEEVEYKAPRES